MKKIIITLLCTTGALFSMESDDTREIRLSGISLSRISEGALDILLRAGTGASGAARRLIEGRTWQKDLEELARRTNYPELLAVGNPFMLDSYLMNNYILRDRQDALKFCDLLKRFLKENTLTRGEYNGYSGILNDYKIRWQV